jgi:hypothetical protein
MSCLTTWEIEFIISHLSTKTCSRFRPDGGNHSGPSWKPRSNDKLHLNSRSARTADQILNTQRTLKNELEPESRTRNWGSITHVLLNIAFYWSLDESAGFRRISNLIPLLRMRLRLLTEIFVRQTWSSRFSWWIRICKRAEQPSHAVNPTIEPIFGMSQE